MCTCSWKSRPKWAFLVSWDIWKENQVWWYIKDGVIWNSNTETASFGVEGSMSTQSARTLRKLKNTSAINWKKTRKWHNWALISRETLSRVTSKLCRRQAVHSRSVSVANRGRVIPEKEKPLDILVDIYWFWLSCCSLLSTFWLL